jgi:hypothetical protein
MYNVFVFCGGKCGGTTISETFNRNGYNSIHLHDFNCNGFNNPNTDITNIYDILEKSCKKHENVFIIDSYRTPIERKISSFFEGIDRHLPNYKNLSIQEIIDFFNNELLNKIENYHSINNILNYFNISLFKNFDFKKGYNLHKHNNMIFIKILFKDIKNWDKILSEIVKKNILIYPKNLTSNKEINEIYEEFKKNYRVPKSYIENELSKDSEFEIYNTQKEQDEYIKKWLEKSF